MVNNGKSVWEQPHGGLESKDPQTEYGTQCIQKYLDYIGCLACFIVTNTANLKHKNFVSFKNSSYKERSFSGQLNLLMVKQEWYQKMLIFSPHLLSLTSLTLDLKVKLSSQILSP
jgi:hypothetical protein